MKKIALILFALSLSGTQAFAAAKTVWNCDDGRSIEAAGVQLFHGKLTGNVSWDCFPGDGICSAEKVVQETKNASGDAVYKGQLFVLVIHTSEVPVKGAYKAHLSATDTQDPQSMGRGFTYNGYLTCEPARK